MKGYIKYFVIILVLTVVIVGVAYFLTVNFGDRCWLPRIGAVIVGLSVCLQGWIIFNPREEPEALDSMQTERKLLKYMIYLALFGTFLWAFGDFQKDLFGIPVCR